MAASPSVAEAPSSAQAHRAITGLAPCLPIELVVAIMKNSSPQDQRNIAATCHQFHAAAYHHAGLSIPVSVDLFEEPSLLAKDLATFREVVKHATLYDLRISLEALLDHGSGDSAAKAQELVKYTCECISEALPLLVALRLVVGDSFRTDVEGSLCQPAPHLCQFEYSCGTAINAPSPAAQLPSNIFGGFAPKLVRVSLEDIVAGDCPAFSAVRTVNIGYDPEGPPTRVSDAFPVVTDLTISRRNPDDLSSWEVMSLSFDLQGLSSERLVVAGYYGWLSLPAIGPADAVSRIPLVEYDHDRIDWCPAFWATIPDLLNLRIVNVADADGDGLAQVTIVPERVHRIRIYTLDPDAFDPFAGDVPPLARIEFLCSRLTYIRLEAVHVIHLLHITSGFQSLRRLQIDVRPSRDSLEEAEIFLPQTSLFTPCPVLEKLVIFALDKPVAVSTDQIGLLAKALVQVSRTPPATLSLVGGTLCLGREASTLASAFPTVEYRPFTGIGSDDDHDSGLWDH